MRRLLLACWLALAIAADALSAGVGTVESLGITVSDMDRSVDFYTRVLGFVRGFRRRARRRAVGGATRLFPVRMRVVRLRLGDEVLELAEYVTPRGRPAPVDARSHDRWFTLRSRLRRLGLGRPA